MTASAPSTAATPAGAEDAALAPPESDGYATPEPDTTPPPAPTGVAKPALREPVAIHGLPLTLWGSILYAAVSPDGRRVAVATEQQLALFDGATGAHLVTHALGLQQLAFSPSGRTLWAAGTDGLVRLDAADGHRDLLIHGGPFPGGFVPVADDAGVVVEEKVATFKLAPAGAAGAPAQLRLYNVEEAVAAAGMAAGRIVDARFDGGRAVLATPTDTVRVTPGTGAAVVTPRPETLPDGAPDLALPILAKNVRVGVVDGAAVVVDATTWKVKKTIPLPMVNAVAGTWKVVATHPEGPRAAFAGEDKTVVVDLASGKLLGELPRTLDKQDAEWPAIFGAAGSELWTFNASDIGHWKLDKAGGPAVQMAATPDRATVVGAGAGLVLDVRGGRINAFAPDGRIAWTTTLEAAPAVKGDGAKPAPAAPSTPHHIVLPPDTEPDVVATGGGRIAIALWNQTPGRTSHVLVLDQATGGLQVTLEVPATPEVARVALAIDAQRVVLADATQVVAWPDTAAAAAAVVSPRDAKAPFVVSTRGLMAAVGGKLEHQPIGADGRLGAAHAVEGAVDVTGAEGHLASAGARAATFVQSRVQVYDLDAGTVVHTVTMSTAEVLAVSPSADGSRVLVHRAGAAPIVVDAASGAARFELSGESTGADLALSDDGLNAVVAVGDLRVYDLHDAEPATVLPVGVGAYLAPVLRDGAVIKASWTATARSTDVDSGKETKTPSKGDGTCTINKGSLDFILECKGIDPKSDYEVKLPSSFHVDADTVSTDAGWLLPLVPVETLGLEVGASDGEELGILGVRRFFRDGETWCYETRQGVAHEAFERLCFRAAGGLASYAMEDGSAAQSIEVLATFAPPNGP